MGIRRTYIRGKPIRIKPKNLFGNRIRTVVRYRNFPRGANVALKRFYWYSTRRAGLVGILGTLAGDIAYRKLYNYFVYNRKKPHRRLKYARF